MEKLRILSESKPLVPSNYNHDKPLEELELDALVKGVIAIYCSSRILLSRINRCRQGCILRRLRPLPEARRLSKSLREGAARIEEVWRRLGGMFGFEACGDGEFFLRSLCTS